MRTSMENFITGYPGHESQHRKSMQKVLGKENCDYFFDKWLEYFFTEVDAKFFASLGLNALRIPFNYRHLEDDMNPRVLKPEGFKHLDRVIDLVDCFLVLFVLPSLIRVHLVREARNIHNLGHAYRARRAKSRLALGQSDKSCHVLGI